MTFVILSSIEHQCDYHQNQAFNSSSSAEQTLVGMIVMIFCLLKNIYSYDVVEMIRTMVSFSAIHILLILITFICGLYSIHEHRYTYKRLTGMTYIVAGKNIFEINNSSLFVFQLFLFWYALKH